jgi:predicted trehalose synthase
VTPSGTDVGVSDALRGALGDLLAVFATQRMGADAGRAARIVDAEVLSSGRPGVIDVVAAVGPGYLHVPFGLRAAEDGARFTGDGDDAVIGSLTDEHGPAVVFDAARDPEVASMLLERISGEVVDASRVRPLHEDRGSITLSMGDRLAFTVFYEVVDGPRRDLELLLALDEQGFNHLAAPLAVWRRSRRDLGLVQECLAGASSGEALALTSVRDLYASGGPPELAGGDFGAEAHRLGTMTARMHLALDRGFGRRRADVGRWAQDVVAVVSPRLPYLLERPDVEVLIEKLRSLRVPSYAIRTHGDFHLGRTSRTEQGWYVTDFSNGGRPASPAGLVDSQEADEDAPPYRSPLADVADMLWSFRHVATSAADERDPSGRDGMSELADAWVDRNRRAFLAGYLGVPGISGLVPPGREVLRIVTGVFELARSAIHDVPDPD